MSALAGSPNCHDDIITTSLSDYTDACFIGFEVNEPLRRLVLYVKTLPPREGS